MKVPVYIMYNFKKNNKNLTKEFFYLDKTQ